jgi:hypothetical protein
MVKLRGPEIEGYRYSDQGASFVERFIGVAHFGR